MEQELIIYARHNKSFRLKNGLIVPYKIYDPKTKTYIDIKHQYEIRTNPLTVSDAKRFEIALFNLTIIYSFNSESNLYVPIVIEKKDIWIKVCKRYELGENYQEFLYFWIDYLYVNQKEDIGIIFLKFKTQKHKYHLALAIKEYMKIVYGIEIFIVYEFLRNIQTSSHFVLEFYNKIQSWENIASSLSFLPKSPRLDFDKTYIQLMMLEDGDIIEVVENIRKEYRSTPEIKFNIVRFRKLCKGKRVDFNKVSTFFWEVYGQKLSLITVI